MRTGHFTYLSGLLLGGFTLLATACGGGGAAGASGESGAQVGYSIAGKVAFSNGSSVSGATVKLLRSGYRIYSTAGLYGAYTLPDTELASTTTGADGSYRFSGLPGGGYSLQALSPPALHLVFRWKDIPTRDLIGITTLSESGQVYVYNPDAGHNSVKNGIIYNTGTPFTLTDKMLSGQDFEASKPGGV